MTSPQQVWEEAYPDRRKWDALDQDTRNEWERVVRVAQESLIAEINRLDYELILRDKHWTQKQP